MIKPKSDFGKTKHQLKEEQGDKCDKESENEPDNDNPIV